MTTIFPNSFSLLSTSTWTFSLALPSHLPYPTPMKPSLSHLLRVFLPLILFFTIPSKEGDLRHPKNSQKHLCPKNKIQIVYQGKHPPYSFKATYPLVLMNHCIFLYILWHVALHYTVPSI
jgi:hypothetical protein